VTSVEAARSARSYPFSDPDGLQLDPLYEQLRRSEPLSRVRLPYGEDVWLATRYADVKIVLGDPRFSRAAAIGPDEPRSMARPSEEGTLLATDPPEHTRLRRVVAKAFTARRVEELRPRTTQIAEELLDRVIEAGPPADLVEHFATPLPVTVICELLGVPEKDRGSFHTWSEAIVSTTSMPVAQIQEYIGMMRAYMTDLIAQRRREPADDLLGAMIKARDEEQVRFSEAELVELAWGLVAAGHETTLSQIPNFVYVLLTNRAEMDELCARPELVPAAVEELMRYVPLGVAAAFPRYATEDVEVGGVLVRAGEGVLASVHSANRDGDAFPDPDVVDFHRETNPHIGFGHGAHHCLGAQLARMELQVALSTLVRRMPGLRFAVAEEELPWKTGRLVRGLKQLPVTW
jgi:cytochrome P450